MGLRLVDLHVGVLVQCLFAYKISIAIAAVEFRGFFGRFLFRILCPRVDDTISQMLVLLHPLLILKEGFTLFAIAMCICNLMLLKSFGRLEIFPTRAANVCVR